MKRDILIGVVFLLGILLTLTFKDFTFLIIPSIGIPASLAYLERHKNILAKSNLLERDTLMIIGIITLVTIAFNFMIDPRFGLLMLGTVVPLIAGLKGR
ncbi:hypothetical protein A3L04_07400 [Thermococcus chitonophagus]|nr:hypothetical protein [Thermococcus chitonophagus]ASJ16908.1 hypothetical protein A3L04_07400 [Thermococcus chitonophagus]